MEKNWQIESLAEFGSYLDAEVAALQEGRASVLAVPIASTCAQNTWFTPTTILQSIKAIALRFLNKNELYKWRAKYPASDATRNIGIIMAGNIPLVGFHDLLCVLISSQVAVIKQSSKDQFLLPALYNLLLNIEPRWANHIVWEDGYQLHNIHKLIATGSNNTARYFRSNYTVPCLIRKNRISVAVLYSNMTWLELDGLSADIMNYFGLGCRSVSHLFVPHDFNFDKLITCLVKHPDHLSYQNCYRYQRAINTLSDISFIDTGKQLLFENRLTHAALATINYQYYQTLEEIDQQLESVHDQLQCIVDRRDGFIPYGSSQQPTLDQYPDQVDTMHFILTT